MQAIYFDGQAGAAGDMILGALLDLGVDLAALKRLLHPIIPAGFDIKVERVSPQGIAATRATVSVVEDVQHRHLSQVLALLEKGDLSARVKAGAAGVFRRLAEAEAHVHSSTAEKVHFHEVGANDAIIDVVGSLWALEQLGVQQAYCAPLVLGSGIGQSAHGAIIYPAPAVLEILKDTPVVQVVGLGETTTPTGAAILAEVGQFTATLAFSPSRIGYGAGQRTFPDRPNLLRATLGNVDEALDHDELWLGASDIDNTRPEVFEWVAERLRSAGAIDVVTSSVSMKKGRLGTRIEVLCEGVQRGQLAQIILEETSSLGVRWHPVTRIKLERRIETVATPWGPIRVKVARLATGERAIPEYDDCRAAASKHHLPLIEVIDRTARLYYDQTLGADTKRG